MARQRERSKKHEPLKKNYLRTSVDDAVHARLAAYAEAMQVSVAVVLRWTIRDFFLHLDTAKGSVPAIDTTRSGEEQA